MLLMAIHRLARHLGDIGSVTFKGVGPGGADISDRVLRVRIEYLSAQPSKRLRAGTLMRGTRIIGEAT